VAGFKHPVHLSFRVNFFLYGMAVFTIIDFPEYLGCCRLRLIPKADALGLI
jgi:hypothetical protein